MEAPEKRKRRLARERKRAQRERERAARLNARDMTADYVHPIKPQNRLAAFLSATA